MIRTLCIPGLFALWTVVVASPVAAGPFSDLVVFGDSLSDIGNISQATFSLVPGRHYADGRFSNGPVYAEALAVGLGLAPLTRHTAGGGNFAYGGAMTSGASAPIWDIDDQVTEFIDTRTTDPDALFVVLAGANDLIGGETEVSVPVGQLASDISRLMDAGARRFLVLNLPLLGMTPRFNDAPDQAATFDHLSAQFNAALSDALDSLEADFSESTVFRLDLATLISQLAASPASFGLVNVTDPAAPGLDPGDFFYNDDQIVDNPNAYLFWDDLHPTAAAHSLLAEQALLALRAPGDYNGDGRVDAADYTVWRDSLGQIGAGLAGDGDANGTVDAADFDLWRAHFGTGRGGGSLASVATSVPEPTAFLLALAAAVVTALTNKKSARHIVPGT